MDVKRGIMVLKGGQNVVVLMYTGFSRVGGRLFPVETEEVRATLASDCEADGASCCELGRCSAGGRRSERGAVASWVAKASSILGGRCTRGC
jgi:hypothetical protein